MGEFDRDDCERGVQVPAREVGVGAPDSSCLREERGEVMSGVRGVLVEDIDYDGDCNAFLIGAAFDVLRGLPLMAAYRDDLSCDDFDFTFDPNGHSINVINLRVKVRPDVLHEYHFPAELREQFLGKGFFLAVPKVWTDIGNDLARQSGA